jgi:UDP-N-acetylmuramate dehydrogenase
MNAGCYGSETWQFVERADTIDRRALCARTAREFETGYRHVALKGRALGTDGGSPAPGSLPARRRRPGSERIKALLDKRIATQPLNLPNAGSVFRNPSDDHAARLVEACGLKGYAIGHARISEKHANFIVNPSGKASAADIEALIEHARAAVLKRFGVALVPEVRIIGEAVEAL